MTPSVVAGRVASAPDAALRLSAAVELGTGAAALVAPGALIELLIGAADRRASLQTRVFGGALVALGAAGAMAETRPSRGIRAAFVIYNGSTAAILGAAGLSGGAAGVLLWPAVLVHGALAVVVALGSREAIAVPRR